MKWIAAILTAGLLLLPGAGAEAQTPQAGKNLPQTRKQCMRECRAGFTGFIRACGQEPPRTSEDQTAARERCEARGQTLFSECQRDCPEERIWRTGDVTHSDMSRDAACQRARDEARSLVNGPGPFAACTDARFAECECIAFDLLQECTVNYVVNCPVGD